MRLAIVGATGFLGKRLVEIVLAGGNDEIIVLTRNARNARSRLPADIEIGEWDTTTVLPRDLLEGSDVVINLAGDSVGTGRWTARKKQAIRASRVGLTRRLVEGIGVLETRPGVLVNGSAIGFYGPRDDIELTDDSPSGDDFLAEVCREWESATARTREFGVRTVLLRTGIVLGPGGGALSKMLFPFRIGAGGRLGDGRQWMSWIHVDDLCHLILHAATSDNLSGSLNATAPGSVTNREFSETLGRVLRRPAVIPMPGVVLRCMIGEFADVLLTGQRVLPSKALQSGFSFRFERLEDALRDILG